MTSEESAGAAPTQRRIGVGVVGLSASGGWGAAAHLPAMAAAGGFDLRGLVASSAASAQRASLRHGAPAYASIEGLVAADDVDLIVVTVKTPHHHDVVLRTRGSKPIFCEWPFAVDAREAEEMAGSARGVATFVGLQGRSTPSFRWLADLVAEGYVGTVLSATVSSTVSEWGSPVSESTQYLLDHDQGASMLGIGLGHALDPALLVVGELSDLVATTATRHRSVPLGRTGREVPMTGVDQIAVSGTLTSGAVLALHQRGGTASGPGYALTVDGTAGTLVATSADHPHITPLAVHGARRGQPLAPLTLPRSYDAFPHLAGSPIHSLTHAYAGIRARLGGGTSHVPDFDEAARRHRLLDAVTESAATGRRIGL